jgi:hypothetical protein
MKIKIFLNVLLLLGAVYLFSMCSDGNRTTYNDNNITHANYNINHYLDTIEGHVILTTVCDEINTGSVSVSTLELNN